jgi:hypothetical protein
MSQVFNLRGTPIENVAELRTNKIMDDSGTYKILEFDTGSNSVILHNVNTIYTKSGRPITAQNIKETV